MLASMVLMAAESLRRPKRSPSLPLSVKVVMTCEPSSDAKVPGVEKAKLTACARHVERTALSAMAG